jgi:hypothetical protein
MSDTPRALPTLDMSAFAPIVSADTPVGTAPPAATAADTTQPTTPTTPTVPAPTAPALTEDTGLTPVAIFVDEFSAANPGMGAMAHAIAATALTRAEAVAMAEQWVTQDGCCAVLGVPMHAGSIDLTSAASEASTQTDMMCAWCEADQAWVLRRVLRSMDGMSVATFKAMCRRVAALHPAVQQPTQRPIHHAYVVENVLDTLATLGQAAPLPPDQSRVGQFIQGVGHAPTTHAPGVDMGLQGAEQPGGGAHGGGPAGDPHSGAGVYAWDAARQAMVRVES